MRCGITLDQIADADSFISDPGLPYHVFYSACLDDGCIELVETAREDIATMINSYKDQTDMSLILARLSAGDASPLYARQAFYGDFSACSYDHRAMLQTVQDAHTYFDHLPDSVRSKFNDSFTEWFSTAGSPEWAKSMTFASSPANSSVPAASAAPHDAGSVSAAIAVEQQNATVPANMEVSN